MRKILLSFAIAPAIIGMVLSVARPAAADAGHDGQVSQGHRTVTAVIEGERSGVITAKTPEGTTYNLNPNAARRHGHAMPKAGDEVTLHLDENNQVIEVHPKGERAQHHFVTGKLIYVGKMKKEIKLSTPDGEKVFPLERLEVKTEPIEEGALVTAELNEAGTVIDLHRADRAGGHRGGH